jgi:hypothetical protein
MNKILNPLQLLTGGYIGVFDVSAGTGWQQLTAEKRPSSLKQRGNVGTRRERRGTTREQWLTSLPHRKITMNAQQYGQHLQVIQKRRQAA